MNVIDKRILGYLFIKLHDLFFTLWNAAEKDEVSINVSLYNILRCLIVFQEFNTNVLFETSTNYVLVTR